MHRGSGFIFSRSSSAPIGLIVAFAVRVYPGAMPTVLRSGPYRFFFNKIQEIIEENQRLLLDSRHEYFNG